jgi:transcription initiation factor TFIID subunit 9B
MDNVARTEDILKGDVPRDAKIVALILKSMGVEEYQPRVLNQFLEFMYRYVSEILQDASIYAEHSGRTGSANSVSNE